MIDQFIILYILGTNNVNDTQDLQRKCLLLQQKNHEMEVTKSSRKYPVYINSASNQC